mgnify:FL=1
MITGILAHGTLEDAFDMSAPTAENTSLDHNDTGKSDGVVATVRHYITILPAKDGLDACIAEGKAIADIVEQLGLPEEILAAVYVYPLFRDDFLNTKSLQNNALKDISRFVIGLQQLNQFSLPEQWQPGEALAVQQSEALRKRLLAVVSAVRLVLVRIADQL